jgi:hypothetical protein
MAQGGSILADVDFGRADAAARRVIEDPFYIGVGSCTADVVRDLSTARGGAKTNVGAPL